MNKMFFRIRDIQKKMEINQGLQKIMKGIGAWTVFVIFLCCLKNPDTMNIAWLFSVLFIALLFVFDAYYISKNKKYEFEIYRFETEDLKKKKKVAEIRGEMFPDDVPEHEIKMPSGEVSLPIVYYLILLILDILIKVFIIH